MDHVELIASENYASPLVMAIQNSVFTNKYAEGYPGKRYYSGCEHVDVAERLAIERLKVLFDCDWANVQPHAGAQAKAAVFLALANPGDTVMGMNVAQGGHLTDDNPSNFSGRHYKIVLYGPAPQTGLIDYDEMERVVMHARPKLLIGGFSAYSRHKDWARMRAIADRAGATFWVDMAHVAGLVRRRASGPAAHWRVFKSAQLLRFESEVVVEKVELKTSFKDADKKSLRLDKRYFGAYTSSNAKLENIGPHVKIEVSPHAIDALSPERLQERMDFYASAESCSTVPANMSRSGR